MPNYRVAICGHFGFGEELLNGQTIKTKVIADELKRQLGDQAVYCFDTHGGYRALVKTFFSIPSILNKSANVIIMPANNGLRVFVPLLTFWNRFFKKKLHYVVIGGWLCDFLHERKELVKPLRKFHGIYVETTNMKNRLEAKGFQNVTVLPNCKPLKILTKEELVYPTDEPYKLCTFSRVMKEKGIADAVEAVKIVNEQAGRTVYTLDIYGQVDANQIEWFDELQSNFPSYVKYGGCVPFDQSTEVLKDYFALVFPTHFYTEGIPGTIIDAYAAGVPVISACWENFDDLIQHGKTGYGYQFDDFEAFKNLLNALAKEPKQIQLLKDYCCANAELFTPQIVIKTLLCNLE